MITSMMLGCWYFRYMGLVKRMSEVLMMPGIVFLCSETCLDIVPPIHGALELHKIN